MAQELTRGAGVLLAISSLPSPYGIGTLGKEAFRFVDLLVDMKQKYWQVLPIGPTGFGDSPYQTLSAFAGNPYLIDLDLLVDEKLLKIEEIQCCNWGADNASIDYAAMFENRCAVLRRAYERFDLSNPDFVWFEAENQEWLDDYALYMTLKIQQDNKPWQEWPEEIKKKSNRLRLQNAEKSCIMTIGFGDSANTSSLNNGQNSENMQIPEAYN